jgi:hypothetical protein
VKFTFKDLNNKFLRLYYIDDIEFNKNREKNEQLISFSRHAGPGSGSKFNDKARSRFEKKTFRIQNTEEKESATA